MTIKVYEFKTKIQNLEKQIAVTKDYVSMQINMGEYKEALRVLQELIYKDILLEEYRRLENGR